MTRSSSRSSLYEIRGDSVGHFDRFEEYAALSEHEREQLRVVVVDHDNDPIATLSPRLIYARPGWLDGQRGRGVPASLHWTPSRSYTSRSTP